MAPRRFNHGYVVHVRRFIRGVLNPAHFHGRGQRKRPFFEGWYFKLVDGEERHRWAVIPGIFLGIEPGKSHAFVQVLDGSSGRSRYHVFPVEDFAAAEDAFDIRIGENRFGARGLSLRIKDDEGIAEGDVRFAGVEPWPVGWAAPGAMGWYAWVPFMECFHGVLSFDHGVSGSLALDGELAPFDGGRGYIEKDWGQSFPSAYVWMQSNHFESPRTCLTASVAMIPWIRRAFRGFIVGLRHEERLYRFATYTGAATEALEIDDERVTWVVRDREFRLEMQARRAEGGLLHGPIRAEMHRRVNETLRAQVAVQLASLTGSVLFEGEGRNTGLEVFGDVARLVSA